MNCGVYLKPETLSGARQHFQSLSSPESGVQLWIAHLDSFSPDEITQLFGSLDSSERTRAEQFYLKRDRHRYVAAHGLLRLGLAGILDCSPAALVLEKSAQGKPEVQKRARDQRKLKFNLSHAAGWALIATSWDRELGVDLESPESLPTDEQALSKLAARVLSERELEVWSAIPNPALRSAAFLRTWTRKEAYVKATGEGLRRDLANIELPADSATFDVPSAELPADRWIVHDLSVPAGLTAALAIELP